MLRLFIFSAILSFTILVTSLASADPPTKRSTVKHKTVESHTAMLTRTLLLAAKARLPSLRKNMAGGEVAAFEDKFSVSPKCLVKDIESYDVEKTSSLTSPYMGYVVVGQEWQFSTKDFFDTKEEAAHAQYSEKEKDSLRLTFAYQSGQWVFKSQRKN